MLRPVRRRIAVLAVVLLVPLLGACTYQTNEVYQAAVGSNNRSGTVDILGAVIVSGTDGSGTFVTSLVNKDLEKSAKLTSVTGPSGVEVQVTKQVEVEPDGIANFAELGAVSVKGESVKAGSWIRLTLEFDSGQKTTINTPVVNRDEEYSEVAPAVPSASPSS
jgi:hypothetical protein